MQAHEYLGQLKASNRFFHYLIEISRLADRGPAHDPESGAPHEPIPFHVREQVQRVLERHGASLAPDRRDRVRVQLERSLAGLDSDLEWPRRVHDEFLQKTSEDGRRLLTTEYDIAVGELQSADLNAVALEVPDNRRAWVVALNSGLHAFVYGFARALAATIAMAPDTGGPEHPPPLAVDEAASKVARMVRYYVHVGVPLQDDWELSDPHSHLASRVTTMAVRFVYLHEISHILLNHTSAGARHVVPLDHDEPRCLLLEHEQEHEADLLAWNLLVSVLLPERGRLGGSELQMAYAGVSLFLRLAELLERTRDAGISATHPPAAKRLDLLREAATRTSQSLGFPFDAMTAMSAALDDAFERVVARCPALPGVSPLEEIISRVDRAAARSRMIDGIMAEADTRRQLLELLAFGAPGKLCRELGRELGRAESELRALGLDVREPQAADFPPTAPDRLAAARQPLARFMLLAGLVEAYLTPEIRRFIDRHHIKYLEELGHVTG